MAGNIDLTAHVLTRIVKQDIDISKLYTYHLATNIFDCLSRNLAGIDLTPMTNFVSDRGHTDIDSLMTTILKSHTSIRLGMVDST